MDGSIQLVVYMRDTHDRVNVFNTIIVEGLEQPRATSRLQERHVRCVYLALGVGVW